MGWVAWVKLPIYRIYETFFPGKFCVRFSTALASCEKLIDVVAYSARESLDFSVL